MLQFFPVDKNAFVQKFISKLTTDPMQESELYFRLETGELFSSNLFDDEFVCLCVHPGTYPCYEGDEYIGYNHGDEFVSKEESINFWSKRRDG